MADHLRRPHRRRGADPDERHPMIVNEKEIRALADEMTRSYVAADVEAIAAFHVPDARIWHNFDGVEQTVEEQLDATRWLNQRLKNVRHEIVSRHFFEGGYVQQSIVHGILADSGDAFAMPTCMNVAVRDGRAPA
jgi:hypothetical protein